MIFDNIIERKISEKMAALSQDQASDDAFEILQKIEKYKIQVCYYDYSHVSIVQSGKLILPLGWYYKENGKEYNMQRRPRAVYDTYLEAVTAAIRNIENGNDR